MSTILILVSFRQILMIYRLLCLNIRKIKIRVLDRDVEST
jgi:hypothetical protein